MAVELDLMEFLQQVSIDPFNSSMDLGGYNATVNVLLFENPFINTTISLVPHKQKKNLLALTGSGLLKASTYRIFTPLDDGRYDANRYCLQLFLLIPEK